MRARFQHRVTRTRNVSALLIIALCSDAFLSCALFLSIIPYARCSYYHHYYPSYGPVYILPSLKRTYL
jgi:hypothetical protein